MSENKPTIFVEVPAPAKDGDPVRLCPIHRDDNPNGGALMIRVGDAPVEVFDSTTIRRRIRSGDLREAKAAPATKPLSSSSK